MTETLLILDFGSQVTQLIARRIESVSTVKFTRSTDQWKLLESLTLLQ